VTKSKTASPEKRKTHVHYNISDSCVSSIRHELTASKVFERVDASITQLVHVFDEQMNERSVDTRRQRQIAAYDVLHSADYRPTVAGDGTRFYVSTICHMMSIFTFTQTCIMVPNESTLDCAYRPGSTGKTQVYLISCRICIYNRAGANAGSSLRRWRHDRAAA
jgi:hypothetical protein